MLQKLLLTVLVLSFATVIAAPELKATGTGPTEDEKIRAMISHVEGLKQARFVRNGVEYDAHTAGRFLRYVWNANRAKVQTAEDFIRVVATASGDGVPYKVRFQDGRESQSREYLGTLLKKLETARRE